MVSRSCHAGAVTNVNFKLCQLRDNRVGRMVTGRGGKLRAPVVKQKSFELKRKGGKYFQADRKRGQIDNASLRWRGKSSSGSEFR